MNLQLNKIGNILPIKSAVSNYSGEAKLYTLNGSLSYTIKSLPKNVISAKMKSIIVKVKTLDRLIDEIGLNKVNFIKIDCEGAELDVLEGAERILSNNDLFLTIAAYHYPGEIFEIAKFLSAKGMRVFSNGAYVYAFK
jgi:FkbM family methyltransferase